MFAKIRVVLFWLVTGTFTLLLSACYGAPMPVSRPDTTGTKYLNTQTVKKTVKVNAEKMRVAYNKETGN